MSSPPDQAPAPQCPQVRLSACDPWPYPRHEYPLRVLWAIVWATLWQVCWKRLPRLRCTILRLFGGQVGGPCHIAGSARIQRPWDLSIGRHSALGPRTILYNLGGVTIGDNTVLSQDVYVCGGTHDYTDPAYPLLRQRITIGSQVWIAAGAFIGPGVTIGDGAVVGARAVVVKDVEPWTVVAGNPARTIKKRVLHAPAHPS